MCFLVFFSTFTQNITKLIKILEYYDHVESSCSFWRGRGALAELEREGHVLLTLADYYKDQWKNIRRNDIAFFQRPMTSMCTQHVMLCKDMGIKVWIDIDDWIEIPKEHPVYDVYEKQVNHKNFRQTLLCADVITVTNDTLKKMYSEYMPSVEARIKVVPNAINDYLYPIKPFNNNKKILWRGGSHHDYDIAPFVGRIKKVMQAHKDWTLFSIGSEIKELTGSDNYAHITNKAGGKFNSHNYMAILLSLQPGIIISPLVKNRLNEGKSNIAWLEATMSGGVAVLPMWMTDTESYQYVYPQQFDLSMESAMSEYSDMRESKYNKSVEIINDRYLLSKTNKERLNIIESIL